MVLLMIGSLMFCLGVFLHQNKIIEHVALGDHVVMDRCVLLTVGYIWQGCKYNNISQ